MRIPDDIYLKLAEEYEKLSWSISQLLRVILTNEFSFSVEQKVESEIDKENGIKAERKKVIVRTAKCSDREKVPFSSSTPCLKKGRQD